MEIEIRPFRKSELPSMLRIWNEAVLEGDFLPQRKPLTEKEATSFFQDQTCTCTASDKSTGVVVGLYILHPDSEGRCGHIAGAGYVVWSVMRHKGIGRKLVEHSLKQTKEAGFRILRFNAVVGTNIAAQKLYSSMGFKKLGVLPEGYQTDSGEYVDTILYYHDLFGV